MSSKKCCERTNFIYENKLFQKLKRAKNCKYLHLIINLILFELLVLGQLYLIIHISKLYIQYRK